MRLKEMLREEAYQEIWDKYCGFIDLSLDEFMEIQERLLLEQIDMLDNCALGKRILHNQKPKTVEEFRQMVPLTTYEDYADILLKKQEDALPSHVMYWIKTTWKGGIQDEKWAPYSDSMIEEHAKNFIAALILSTSKKRYDFSLRDHDKFLYGMAPLPFLTGLAPYGLKHEIEFDYLPPTEEAERLDFKERNKEGFRIALNEGVDLFFGLSSVLVKMGEEFMNGSSNTKKKIRPKNVKVAFRLIRAFYKKKILKQPLLPKDLFHFKGILCGGTDSREYKDKIEYLFGKRPIEIFGGTEIATVAIETWGGNGLTFFPDVNFLEFIPEHESIISLNDKDYVPQTVLLNELVPGEKYEIVTTKFRGGAFVRYRVGDMIQCMALEDTEHQIHLPQIRYIDRIANVIDLAGFTRITRSSIDQAIEQTNLPAIDWCATKEFINQKPILHLYLELASPVDNKIVTQSIHEQLKLLDIDYQNMETLLDLFPLNVTLLDKGSFSQFKKGTKQQIDKINPAKEVLEILLNGVTK